MKGRQKGDNGGQTPVKKTGAAKLTKERPMKFHHEAIANLVLLVLASIVSWLAINPIA